MTAETFFKELKRLILIEPKPASHILNSEACDYGDHIYYSNNLYYAFDCTKCVFCGYAYDSMVCNNSYDIDYCGESELLYECIDAYKCFNSNYLENCLNTHDSWYSYGCIDSKNLFGCVLLRNKSFCIFNRQLSENEYFQKVEQFKKWPPQKVLEMVEDLKKRYPKTQTNEAHNENSSFGDHVYYCKNCYLCFDASYNENSGYLYVSNNHKNCYNVTYSEHNELCYEITDSAQCFNCNYIVYSAHCQDSSYIIDSFDIKNSLGCVGLLHKQYCILNRQFTKEEYIRISTEILEDIKRKKLGWGDITYL